MASIGHAAMGLGGARCYRGARPGLADSAFLVALSYLPDGDVGMLAVVPYAHPFGHRGAFHSLAFALAFGVLVWLGARGLKLERANRFGLIATLVLASHGLLDTMTLSTGGGLGVALFWPFDTGRYWAPWRPIPIAPIGLDFFSRRGAYVFAVETLEFLPLFVLAFLPARRAKPAGREIGHSQPLR